MHYIYGYYPQLLSQFSTQKELEKLEEKSRLITHILECSVLTWLLPGREEGVAACYSTGLLIFCQIGFKSHNEGRGGVRT